MRKTEFEWSAVLERLVRGDAAAHEQVAGLVSGLLRRADLRGFAVSEADIAQDVLLAIVRAAKRGAIRDPRAFGRYCAVIVRNEVARRLAQRRRLLDRHVYMNTDLLLAPDRRDHDPDVRIDLERAFTGLPPRVRDALQKIYLEGHSYEHAARTLGVRLGTLKTLQTSGLRMLREAMLPRAA